MRKRSRQEGSGSDDVSDASVMVRRSNIAACVTCGLCGSFLRDATTISECLHAFCGKCISEKFKDEDNKRCPTCNIDLGCDPKLRADRSLQCISSAVSAQAAAFAAERTEDAPEASLADVVTGLASTSVPLSPSTAGEAAPEEGSASLGAGEESSQAEIHLVEVLAAVGAHAQSMLRDMASLSEVRESYLQELRARSMEKSLFIRQLWDSLAKETRLRKELAEQLAAARREVAELAPACQELASLRIKESDARVHAREAEEKLAALIERARTDAAESARVRKERDELLRAVEGLRAELEGERNLKVQAEVTAAKLAVEVSRQGNEARKLREQVNGLDGRLAAEVVKSRDLERKLGQVKDSLLNITTTLI